MSSTTPAKTGTFTPPDWPSIVEAHARIAPRIHRTPVMTSKSLDAMVGARVFFKCENLQKTGSFKIRGATNAIFSLGDEEVSHGIVTQSSGNHGAAVACAAAWRGVPAWIVMPRNAPAVKRLAVEGYGGRVTLCEPTMTSRNEATSRIQAETGAHLIHPYDDDRVIAGQATASKEFLEEIGDLDAAVRSGQRRRFAKRDLPRRERPLPPSPRFWMRAGAGRRRLPFARDRDSADDGRQRHDRGRVASLAFAANVCNLARARCRNPSSQRGRDHLGNTPRFGSA